MNPHPHLLLADSNPTLPKKSLQKSLQIGSLFLLLLIVKLSWALPSDSEQQLQLQADAVEFFHKTGLGFYRGHVALDQGSTHLRTEQAKTIHDKNNQLLVAIAYGKVAEPAHYWTLPKKNEPEMHAYADIIYYYPQQKKVILKGQARFIQGENHYMAPEIVYDMAKGHIVSEARPQGRTTIVWHQDPNHKNLMADFTKQG